MMRNFEQSSFERARRKSREIMLAVALTLAAAIFGVSALQQPDAETASVVDSSGTPETSDTN